MNQNAGERLIDERRISFTARLLGAFALAVSLATPGAAQSAAAAPRTPVAFTCNGTWQVQATSDVGTKGSVLNAVSADSPTDAWAVGVSNYTFGAPQTLIEHWDGTSWSVAPSPNVGIFENDLFGVFARTATDVWAVGSYLANGTVVRILVEHFNGSGWTITPTPDMGNSLSGISARAANDAWAVGEYSPIGGVRTLVMHWDGGQWSQVTIADDPTAFNDHMYGVAEVSSSLIWAVGAADASNLIERSTGGWSVVPSPNVTGKSNQLSSISALGSLNAWAVGTARMNATGATLTEHWDGTAWSIVPSKNRGAGDNRLWGVAVASATKVFAVGNSRSASGNDSTLIEKWNGTRWVILVSPNPGVSNHLRSVTKSSLGHAWAAGNYYDATGGVHTLVEAVC